MYDDVSDQTIEHQDDNEHIGNIQVFFSYTLRNHFCRSVRCNIYCFGVQGKENDSGFG